MDTQKLELLNDELRNLDRRIKDFRDALNPEHYSRFAVTGGDIKRGGRCEVEITFEMAEPFLRIGLRTAERKRTAIAEQIRAL